VTPPETWHRELAGITGEISLSIVRRTLHRKQIEKWMDTLAAVYEGMAEFKREKIDNGKTVLGQSDDAAGRGRRRIQEARRQPDAQLAGDQGAVAEVGRRGARQDRAKEGR